MNSELTHDEVLDLLAGYALGILDPEEMLAVDTSLPLYPYLQARFEEIEEVVAQYAVQFAGMESLDVAPPSLARERLLARVEADAQQTAAPVQPVQQWLTVAQQSEVVQRPPPGSSASKRPAVANTAAKRWQAFLDRWRGGFGVWVWAATLLVWLATAVLLLQRQQQLNQLQTSVAVTMNENTQLQQSLTTIQDRVTELQTQLSGTDRQMAALQTEKEQLQQSLTDGQGQVADLQSQLAQTEDQMAALAVENTRLTETLQQEQQITAVLASANQTIPLAATDIAPFVSGEYYRRANEVVLVARGLERPPADKAYYLWGVVVGPNDEKDFTNLGLVPLRADGSVILRVTAPTDASQYDVIDVSLEDRSDPPPPILEGDIILRGQSS